MGAEEQLYLLATDAGYGFVAKLGDMYANKKAGKALIKVPEGGEVIVPQKVDDLKNDLLVSVTNQGYLLIFPISDLPVMAKGKGVKVMSIPKDRFSDRSEFMVSTAIMKKENLLVVHSKKKSTKKWTYSELTNYVGSRAKRGRKLPNGYKNVTSLSIELKL